MTQFKVNSPYKAFFAFDMESFNMISLSCASIIDLPAGDIVAIIEVLVRPPRES